LCLWELPPFPLRGRPPPQQSPEQQSFLVAHPAGDSSSHKTFSRIRKTVFKKLL